MFNAGVVAGSCNHSKSCLHRSNDVTLLPSPFPPANACKKKMSGVHWLFLKEFFDHSA